MEVKTDKMIIPLGIFDHDNKIWHPNPIIPITEKEQYIRNLESNFLDLTWSIGKRSK